MLVNPVATLLQQRLLQCPQYARLLARSRQKNLDINIAGLTDSAKSLLLSTLSQDLKRPIFFIVADNHLAAFYERELTEMGPGSVLLYPASEISPYEQVLSSPDNIASQLEVLLRLEDRTTAQAPALHIQNHPIVIVPTRALVQRVLDKQTLQANTFILTTGQEIDRDNLANQLINLGYKREALVTLRGEFSIRGDIIDLYPSAYSPVRIELFGDQIESIRTFGLDDQRSITPCDRVVVPPRYWVVLHDDEARAQVLKYIEETTERRAEELDAETAETLRSMIEEEKLSFAANLYPESIEYYAPFFHNQFASLVDYLPDNSLLVFDDWDAIMLSLNSYDNKLQKSYAEGLTGGRLLPLPGPLHLPLNQCQDKLKSQDRLFFNPMPISAGEAGTEIQFHCHPVEHFANQMKTVVEKIKTWQSAEYTVLVNSEQPQRIIDLLREWDCVATYVGGTESAPAGGAKTGEAKPAPTGPFAPKSWSAVTAFCAALF